MINGNFKGRESKTETLKDVDEDTFSRFCEFAYKGDYCPPAFELEKDDVVEANSDAHVNGESDSDAIEPATTEGAVDYPVEVDDEPPPAEEVIDPFDGWGSNKKGSKKKKKENAYFEEPSQRALFRQAFLVKEYPTTHSIDATVEACKPVRNIEPNENFSPIFLGHAQLYVFADKYDIQPLKLLALKKLQQTLALFSPFRERIGDVVELVEYTYENTGGRTVGPDEGHMRVTDELRDLVVGYVVSELESISGDEFDSLIEKGGDFVVDFWHTIKDGVLES